MNENTLDTKYSLEIYEPNSAYDPMVHFESKTPGSEAPMKVLKVLNVEHMIWEIEDSHITHKLCVFTEEVEGTAELRLEK